MPELPEVETVRCQLARSLVGKHFAAVEKIEPAMLADCTERQVRRRLPGRRVESVDRLGKFLVVALDEGAFITAHLGMTGHLLVSPEVSGGSAEAGGPGAESPYSRFVFLLEGEGDSRSRLEFRDMRKFGRFHLTRGGPAPRLSNLGPDAWGGAWDLAYLAKRLRGRKAPLKAILLDQRHLAGIGNIYADEILWWTGLSPLRPGGSLSAEEVGRLSDEIPRRLGEGVRLLGCSISDFVDTEGKAGNFQEWLRAYGKQGQACSRCGESLKRTMVAGRGTAYCPGCQK